jgi:hypothetical protein
LVLFQKRQKMSFGDRQIVRSGKIVKFQPRKEKKMSKEVARTGPRAAIERVLIHGDLSPMNEAQRLDYVKAVCRAIGVSILFRPFDYIKLNGRLVLYANRACTEQLRIIHRISIKITARERVDGLYVVTAQATSGKGKTDESIGAVNIKGLAGEALANALMKAETKAKRRVTLSIAGLGMLDEVEARQIADLENKATAELAIEATTEKLAESESRPEFEEGRPEPSVAPAAQVSASDSDYTLKVVRGLKGKKITAVPLKKLVDWLAFYDATAKKGDPLAPEVQDEALEIRNFLNQPTPEV